MSLPRLFFFDLDGTLLTSDRRVTPRTRAAIDAVKARGARVTLSTGRVFSSARPYADAMGADAPLVLYNGARVQAPGTGEVLREWRIDVEVARAALDALAGWDVHVSLFQDEGIYIPGWSERARESAAKDGVTFTVASDLRQKLHRPPLKMMLIGDADRMEDLRRHLSERLPAGAVSIVRTEPTYVELWHKDASKAVAARTIADDLGIPMSEVAAFGDNLNDLDLVRAAGLGVAMANAVPELKRAAAREAPSNDAEGVASVLEELLGAA
jgi:Cof subfamily protein (haloacid dehalogenase superfamily)